MSKLEMTGLDGLAPGDLITSGEDTKNCFECLSEEDKFKLHLNKLSDENLYTVEEAITLTYLCSNREEIDQIIEDERAYRRVVLLLEKARRIKEEQLKMTLSSGCGVPKWVKE